MKPVRFHRAFDKHYKKRIAPKLNVMEAFAKRYALFLSGERGRPLDDHPLTGSKFGKRAFSITGDIRVIYEETADAIIFLDIGTHAQVYDK